MVRVFVLALMLAGVVAEASMEGSVAPSDDVFEFGDLGEDFVPLSMVQLEEHEDTPTPPFSVCKYLLEEASKRVTKEHGWVEAAKHIADIRESLPKHVKTACDSFIKHNADDIIVLLQTEDITADIEAIASQAAAESAPPVSNLVTSDPPAASAATTSAESQQLQFAKFWQEKGQYCGACLTMTKKLQKWLGMECTRNVVLDRVMRLCATMPTALREVCLAERLWIGEFVLKEMMTKVPLPNHCAYIGLCEKTMVIRSLQNPMVAAETQNALLQDMEGTRGDATQEDQVVLQKAHQVSDLAPEVTFNLDSGSVSYQDVDRALGADLPKLYVDPEQQGDAELVEEGEGADDDEVEGEGEEMQYASMLQTGESVQGIFDVSEPTAPKVTVHAQHPAKVSVPIMHEDLKTNQPIRVDKETYGFQQNKVPVPVEWLKGCSSCQFTIGALYEFLSNPRTIRTLLPSVQKACSSCRDSEEIAKCENFVEHHGVAFYQDVVKQGSPKKWCPRLQLCELQYFYPSPHILSDHYSLVRDKLTSVDDF